MTHFCLSSLIIPDFKISACVCQCLMTPKISYTKLMQFSQYYGSNILNLYHILVFFFISLHLSIKPIKRPCIIKCQQEDIMDQQEDIMDQQEDIMDQQEDLQTILIAILIFIILPLSFPPRCKPLVGYHVNPSIYLPLYLHGIFRVEFKPIAASSSNNLKLIHHIFFNVVLLKFTQAYCPDMIGEKFITHPPVVHVHGHILPKPKFNLFFTKCLGALNGIQICQPVKKLQGMKKDMLSKRKKYCKKRTAYEKTVDSMNVAQEKVAQRNTRFDSGTPLFLMCVLIFSFHFSFLLSLTLTNQLTLQEKILKSSVNDFYLSLFPSCIILFQRITHICIISGIFRYYDSHCISPLLSEPLYIIHLFSLLIFPILPRISASCSMLNQMDEFSNQCLNCIGPYNKHKRTVRQTMAELHIADLMLRPSLCQQAPGKRGLYSGRQSNTQFNCMSPAMNGTEVRNNDKGKYFIRVFNFIRVEYCHIRVLEFRRESVRWQERQRPQELAWHWPIRILHWRSEPSQSLDVNVAFLGSEGAGHSEEIPGLAQGGAGKEVEEPMMKITFYQPKYIVYVQAGQNVLDRNNKINHRSIELILINQLREIKRKEKKY
ncbi:uncharacterized protein VP01_1065g7 [Puccinia sorghi]|uniref:Uncharacterized protein n=1 Tax=Puccinia sorghi TaxID=27349 RepID=A0A0L6VV61_9BASI|nr:uncharacterized protein VP01_1065g7 [Puccinia sorghi]